MTVDDGFGHWLAGFIDGEGSFLIDRGTTATVGYTTRFSLILRMDDRPILEEIMRRTGLGVVTSGFIGKHQRPITRWTVGTKKDCTELVALLTRYPLRAKKVRDFVIWTEAVAEWNRVNPWPGVNAYNSKAAHDWSRMAQLRELLIEGRKFNAEEADLPELEVTDEQLSLSFTREGVFDR